MDPSQNGNPRKWVETVLQDYEARLLRYARRIAGDEESAADVVQFAFMKLCGEVLPPTSGTAADDSANNPNADNPHANEATKHSWGEIRHVGQWLYRVCRNRAIDLLRQAGRMPTIDTSNIDARQADASADKQDAAASALYGRGSAMPAPGTSLETSDTCAAIKNIMSELPSGQQEVVDLWADGLSYREIAGVTGRTEVNVRVTAHRAFRALREHPLTRKLAAAEA